MPSEKKKPIPEFPSEDAEREFWAKHDSTGFIDWQSEGRQKFPNLRPTFLAERIRNERPESRDEAAS